MLNPEKTLKLVRILSIIGCGVFFVACTAKEMDRKDKVAAIVGTLQDPFMGMTLTPQVFIEKSGIEGGGLPFAYQTMASFLISGDKTGIANEEQMQIIIENSGGMIPNAFAFIPLESASKFRALLSVELGKPTVKDGVSYIRKDEDNYVVAWKDDLAIVTNITLSLDNLFSKGTNESKKVAIRLVKMLNEASNKTINTEFRSFFDQQGDVRMYANGTTAYELVEGMPFLSKKDKNEIKSLLEGSIIESSLNFEDGQIDFKTDYALAEGLETYFKVLKSSGVSDDMLAQGLTVDPLMAISLNLSLPDFVKALNMQRALFEADDLERDLARMNIELNEIDQLFTGEMLVMVDALQTKEESYVDYKGETRTYSSEEPIFGTVIGVKNTASVEELLKQSLLEGGEAGRLGNDFYAIKNNQLFITNSQDWLSAFNSGNTVSITKANQQLSSSPIGIQIATSMAEKLDLLEGGSAINSQLVNLAGKITETGLEMSVKMKDGSKNALALILEGIIEAIANEGQQNPSLESLLDDEVMQQLEADLSKGIENVIDSKEMQDLKEVLKAF